MRAQKLKRRRRREAATRNERRSIEAAMREEQRREQEARRAAVAAFGAEIRAQNERHQQIRARLKAVGARLCPNCEVGYLDPASLTCQGNWKCSLNFYYRPQTPEGEARLRRFRREFAHLGCQLCGYGRGAFDISGHLQAHHLTYRARRGDEPDDHLVLLCDPCHKKLHQALGWPPRVLAASAPTRQ